MWRSKNWELNVVLSAPKPTTREAVVVAELGLGRRRGDSVGCRYVVNITSLQCGQCLALDVIILNGAVVVLLLIVIVMDVIALTSLSLSSSATSRSLPCIVFEVGGTAMLPMSSSTTLGWPYP